MNYQIEEIDRALVAIFDIEGYSQKNPQKQAQMVQTFIDTLDSELNNIEICKPDIFSTGDGAIVAIGKNCKLDKLITREFFDFVINFTEKMMAEGPTIRTAINYSEKDNAVIIKDSKYFKNQYIQTGDTINVASRIINYCEPGEIILNKLMYKWLRNFSLEEKYNLYKNKSIITKHGVELVTYSFVPEEDSLIYNPKISPEQGYKQYLYIPPVKGNIINFFKKHGLDYELEKVISSSFESLKSLNQNQSFLSRHDIIDVLMQLEYDPEDTIYVISRNDRETGFWTQPRKEKYLDYLKSHKKDNGGVLNQKRVMVYNDSGCKSIMNKEDIYFDLIELHNDNTFYRFPVSGLLRYKNIQNLLFGATISKNHKFAIIPLPEPESFGYDYPIMKDIGNLFNVYTNYQISDGPMKAIITHNKAYVETLIEETESLICDKRIKKINKEKILEYK